MGTDFIYMSWGAKLKESFHLNRYYFLSIFVVLAVSLFVNPVFGFQPSSKIQTGWNLSSQASPFVKTDSDSTVYFIGNDKKYVADDSEVLKDFYVLGSPTIVTQEFLDGTAFGGSLSRVVGSTADSNIYLIIAGIRLQFPDCDLVNAYGFSCTELMLLTPDQLATFHSGPNVTSFVKGTANKTVYFALDGEKRPIASWGDLVGLGVPFVINKLTDSFVNSIPTGDILFGGGGLIKAADSASVYAVNDWDGTPSVYPVTSFNNTVDLGLGTSVRTVSSDLLAQYSISEDLKTTVKCGSYTYVGTSGVLYKIDSSLYSHYGYTVDSFIDGGSICNRFTFSSKPMSRFISNRGSIYYVTNGVKRGFTSYSAFLENGGSASATIPVSNAFANEIPSGSVIRPVNPRGEYEIKIDLYARLNAERAARGLPALGWNSYLNNNARNWSVQMANSNSFAHSNLYPLLNTFYVAAENIGLAGAGARSGALHVAWMNSTGHRVNLLGRNLDVVGIGVYCAPDGRMWVTQQFGRWPGSALPTTFGPTPSVNPIAMPDSSAGATC